MATYIHSFEVNGQIHDFETNSPEPPNQTDAMQAVQQYYTQDVPKGLDLQNQKQKSDQVENMISGRKSMIQDLTLNPPKWNTPSAILGSGLRTLGGASELTEGVPASIGLALQKGQPQSILPDIMKTLTGQRPAQMGDIYRASNLPGISSEPFAKTAGLITSSLPQTPSGALGTVVGNTVVKPIFKGLGMAVQGARQLGVPIPKLSEAISFMTGERLSPNQVESAISNPNILDKKAVNNKLDDARDTLDGVRSSLTSDKTATVPLQQSQKLIDDLGLKVGGQPTRQLTQLTDSQSAKVQKWVDGIKYMSAGKNSPSVNIIDGTIAEIDKSLESYYKEVGSEGSAVRTPFEAIAGKIRSYLSDSLKTAHPDLGAALDEFSQASKDKATHDAFFSIHNQKPSFFRALPVSLIMKASGVPYIAAGPISYGSTFPAVYGKLIQGGGLAGKVGSKLPGIGTNALRNLQQS